MAFYIVQFLTGLASAASLFLVASGLSIIFGVTRIVNFAHGSLYMLGAYLAWTLVGAFGRGPMGFWGAVALAALAVAVIGASIEWMVLKRIYAAPELLQLAARYPAQAEILLKAGAHLTVAETAGDIRQLEELF